MLKIIKKIHGFFYYLIYLGAPFAPLLSLLSAQSDSPLNLFYFMAMKTGVFLINSEKMKKRLFSWPYGNRELGWGIWS
jgi:hypothetical protein